jgi:DNA-binding CsgD family transcriptional regulator/tetratricopeptide (TPR) repeat protein
VLRGRRRECAALDGLLEAVSAGESRALVVRGEPGMGKTALLEYAVQRASNCRVVRAAGVESEMELAFAGLHQLCAPLLDRLVQLPPPQRDALRTAFGLSVGDAPDRFLVSLAVLSLLCDAAEEQPLVCLVDDAQWLDRASEQALAFVARRLLAESVALIFAVRARSEEQELAGLPELVVEGLRDRDARALLDSAISGPLDERVRDRIVAETRGNPLALLELPRGLAPAELAGGFGLLDAAPLPTRIEGSFLRRVERMPAETQRLLLIAAAEPVGDPMLLWRTADRLGVNVDAALAGAEDMIALDGRVRFRHPLIRSAVYRVASAAGRREVHAALAESIPADVDPDRRVWHRAHAAAGPDEAVAAELEASADRAQVRGGLAAAAAFLERAVELTPDPKRRAERALAAAEAAHAAGAGDAAIGLLGIARHGPLDDFEDARCGLLVAQIAFSSRRGRDAASLLVAAAKRLEPFDGALAHASYLQAFWAAAFANHLGGDGKLEVAAAVRAAPPAREPRSPADLMLDGLATRFIEGYASGAPALRRALHEFRAAGSHGLGDTKWVWLAVDLWDADAWFELGTRQVQVSRETGALSVLPLALHSLAAWHVLAGEFARAETLLAEADSIMAATGDAPMHHARLRLVAQQGRDDAEALIESSMRDATARGEGIVVRHAEHAAATLYNALGRFDDALHAARQEVEHNPTGFYKTALPELVEAAVRSDRPDLARRALVRLCEQTQASGTTWARGVEARSRALVSDGEEAEALYRQAIGVLEQSRLGVELARAQLVYGEWLRSERRRRDAREQLREAHERFTAMGAGPFAERAARALGSTGEIVHKRTPASRGELTAQEAQIARLAGDGLSNAEIGAQLFLSSRTVEYHLHKVFAKLDISSRTQLDGVLSRDAAAQPV